MKHLLFFAFILLLAFSCSKDLGIGRSDVFLKYYSWGQANVGADFQQTKDNGYVVASTVYLKEDSMQMCLFKTDEFGNLAWSQSWAGDPKSTAISPKTIAASVAEDNDGNLYMFGTYQKTPTNSDLILCCYKSNGELIWFKTYGSSANEVAKDIIVSSDGGVMMLAGTDAKNLGNQNPSGKQDVLLIKANAKADSLWSRVYGGIDDDIASTITEKQDHDGFLICGSTSSFSDLGQDKSNILLISTNQSGVEISKKTFGGVGQDFGAQVEMPDSHNIYLTGTISDNGNSQVVLINTTEDIQDVKYTKTLHVSRSDMGQSLSINPDGTVAITGTTTVASDGTSNALLLKTSSDGEMQFFRSFGSSGSEIGRMIRTPKSGNGYIILFNSTIDKSSVVSLLRTDADGTLKTN